MEKKSKANKLLLVLLGPTGVGKTDLSIELAKKFNAQIISSDSRQFYKEMRIGTAVPDEEQLNAVPHHLVQHLSVKDYYNVSNYETEVMGILDNLFEDSDVAMLVGGSAMYIDVVCNGIDELPDVDMQLREDLMRQYKEEGIESLRAQLKVLDPEYYNFVDLKNYKRILKGLEVTIQTGKPYSSFRRNNKKERPFHILKIGLNRDREELFDRINRRVDQMVEEGLKEEAQRVFPMKDLNALNTVGYKEIFAHFEGEYSFEKAVELIKRNTRRFSKRQLTWWARDKEIQWFQPNQGELIEQCVRDTIHTINSAEDL